MGEVDPKKLEEQLLAAVPEQHRRFADKVLAEHGVPKLPEGENPVHQLLGWTAATATPQVEVALQHDKVRLIANALGTPPAEVIEEIHWSGRLVAALCGAAKQARAHRDAGVDIIIAQGYEGGGHTGEIGSVVLVARGHRRGGADAGARRWRHRHRPPDRRGAGHGRPGRVDRLAVADRAGGRRAAGADGVLPGRHQPRHRALALVHRQAVPHAAQ